MKIAISVVAPDKNAKLDLRFGRAAAFAIVDTDTKAYDVMTNPAKNASGGAGLQVSELMSEKGAEAAISGAFGPKAASVLSAANIKMYTAKSGTVDELVAKLLAGDLDEAVEA
jgi:predicted Fe-Mo cluster-binding NifX family protein